MYLVTISHDMISIFKYITIVIIRYNNGPYNTLYTYISLVQH